MLKNNDLAPKPVLGGCGVIMAVVGDKCPQGISKAEPDRSTVSAALTQWKHFAHCLWNVCSFRCVLDTSIFPAAIITFCPVFSRLVIGSLGKLPRAKVGGNVSFP